MKKKRAQSGQALVEFIIVIIPLLIILSGVVDLVHAGVLKHVLDSACREGARVAAAIPNVTDNDQIVISRVNKVLMDSHVYDKASVSGLTVSFSSGGSTAQENDIIQVRVRAGYSHVFSFISGVTQITGEATSRYLF